MMQKQRKTVIVAGGAGEVGQGIVRAFRKAGYSVVIPSRSPERLHALDIVSDDGVDLVETDLSDSVAARNFAEGVIKHHGGIHAVVAALGGWTKTGRLLDITSEGWSHVLQNNLTSHLVISKQQKFSD